MKNFLDGEVLTESDLDVYCVNTIFAEKVTNESVTSSVTVQNDDALFLPLAANSTYWIEGTLSVDGASAGDFRLAFTGPSGATILLHIQALAQGAASGSDGTHYLYEAFGTEVIFGTIAAADHRPVSFRGRVKVGSTAGNLQLQWAQGASSGTATRVLTDSTMWARRIN